MRWSPVLAALACGLLAGVQLGVIGPIELDLRRDLGISPEQAAWAASAITAVPAVLGLAGGLWIRRHGARRAIVIGLIVLAAAGGAAGFSPNGPVLLAARVVQGAGYLLAAAGAPIAIARMTQGATRRAALALWTTVIPAGLSIAAAAGGWVSSVAGWRAWLLLAAAALVPLTALAAALLTEGAGAGAEVEASRPIRAATLGRPVLLAAGFGLAGLVGVAVVVSFPTYLAAGRGVASAAAGAATGLVSLSSIAGSLAAGWLVRRGAGLRALAPVGLLMAVAAIPAFSGAVPASANVAAGMLVMVVDGVVVAATFASVPDVSTGPGGGVELTNGVIAQLGSLGTLLGPPLFAAAVALAGWTSLWLVALALMGAATGLLLAATVSRPAGPASPRRRSGPSRPRGRP